MRRLVRRLLLATLFATLLCVSAFAMDTTKDAGHPAAGERVKYSTEAGGTVKVSGDDNEMFSVTATGGTAGEQYVLFVIKKTGDAFTVPTQDNIIYIDQTAADASGKITFETVFPSELTMGTEYEAHIVGADKAYAESKATFSYEYVTYTLGDVDDNGKITVWDATLTLQMVAEIMEPKPTSIQKSAADVNCDGKVTVLDAQGILQKVAELIESFDEIRISN